MTQTRIIAPSAKFHEGHDVNIDSDSLSELSGLGVQKMAKEQSQASVGNSTSNRTKRIKMII